MHLCCWIQICLLLLLAAFTIWKSTKARYYVKMTAITLGSVFISTVLIFPFCLYRRDYRNALLPAWGVRNFIAILGNSFEVRGAENINKNKGGIVLINHQSIIDISVLAHLWPLIGVATTVSRRIIMFLYPPSFFWGTLYINRSNHRETLDTLNKESEAINQRNAKLLMFPEGTRHGGEQLLPFKKGPFHIAIQSQSFVQPVVVSRYTFLNHKAKVCGSGHSIISILPVIDCKGMTKDDLPNLLAKSQKLMQQEYDALNALKSE